MSAIQWKGIKILAFRLALLFKNAIQTSCCIAFRLKIDAKQLENAVYFLSPPHLSLSLSLSAKKIR